MTRWIFLFCFFILQLYVTAQQHEAELLNQLRQYNDEDTNRLNVLNDLAYTYQNSNPKVGLEFADESIKLAGKLSNQEQLSKAYIYKGMNYAAMGQQGNALKMYNASMETLKQAKISGSLANVYNAMGVAYNNLSDKDGAIEYHLKALKIYEAVTDQTGIATTNCNISMVHNASGDDVSALKLQKDALAIFENLKDTTGIVKALGSMATSYNNLKEPEKALEYYGKALLLSRQTGNTRGIVKSLINIGTIYNTQNNFQKTLECYDEALNIIKQSGYDNERAYLLCETGRLIAKAPPAILVQFNILPEDRFEKVLFFLNESVNVAKNTGNKNVQALAWQQLSELYQAVHNSAEAFTAYKKYKELKDSIANENEKQQIIKLTMQYDFDKKQVLNIAQIQKEKLIRNWIVGVSGLLLLFGILFFKVYKTRSDAIAQKAQAEMKAEIIDNEMKALRAQMNPHFISNTLSSINSYVLKNDIKNASNYLTKFAKVIRMILDNSEHKKISLSEDLKALVLYVQLESVRQNVKFSFEIRVDETIDQEVTLIPPLILQPFVENSIWHGMPKKDGGGKILLDISRNNDMLCCVVEDNGVGRQVTKAGDRKAHGMKITEDRISMLNKLEKVQSSILIIDLIQGTRAEVKLPFETKY